MAIEFFEIEGRAAAVYQPGFEGSAWVWEEQQWRWAPALASKDGVRLSASDLRREFPSVDMEAALYLPLARR